ncbi:MAG: hypothetical protein IKR31_07230 [Prevotella sp.]|nr:hypothetical protein [Prevotella sp.]
MRKLKLLFAGFALLGGLSANAQTDVTSTYLTNAGFDDCTAETSDVAAKTIKDYSSNGWINASTGSFTTIAVTAYGGGYKVGNSTTPSTKKDGTTVSGNTLGIIAGWGDDVIIQSDDITLPAGNYTLTVDHYLASSTANYGTSRFGFVTASESYLVSSTTYTASEWTTEAVIFTLTKPTTGKIQIGVKGNNKEGSGSPAIFYDDVKILQLTELEIAKAEALAALPKTAGDGLFTMNQTTIDTYTGSIIKATTVEAVNAIKADIIAWAAPATSGSWNIKNVNAGCYLGTNEGNVVLSELPVAITFEKTTNGFYIKAGEKYINMKGGDTWSMSATDVANTAWTFTAADGKYTITGPNGVIGTDKTVAGSPCYGNKAAGNNGTWTISTAVSEEEIAITVAKNALQAAINAHPVPTANIGSGVFQYNSDAVNDLSEKITAAQAVLDNASATKDQVDAQTDIITGLSELVLNAPDAEKIYNIVVSTTGHAKEGNPVIIIPGETSANNPTGYAMNANFESNANLAQAFTFTKVAGNTYKISTILAGENVYLTNGTLNGSAAGWKDSQIQATTNAENAMAFNIAASEKAGSFNIYNSATNTTIACQAGGNIYTEAGNADFTLVETAKPSITINTTAAGWGTVMLPFAVASLPTGVKAYTCDKIEGITLTLDEVDALEANKPYIIEGAWNEVVSGDAQGKALTATEGLLTGTYTTIAATDGQYVLQNQGGKVAFYQVDTEVATPNVPANRAYLEAPSTARALYFDAATAIKTIEALTSGEAEIYGANGARQNGLKKGVNIIKRGDKTMKVMVK